MTNPPGGATGERVGGGGQLRVGHGTVMFIHSRVKKGLSEGTHKEAGDAPRHCQAQRKGEGVSTRAAIVGPESREKCGLSETHLISIFGGSEENF